MEIKKDSNMIPIPGARGVPTELTKIAAALKVGESFVVKGLKSSPRGHLWRIEKGADVKFSERKIGNGEYRVWRVK